MTDITAKLAETLAQEPWPAKVRLGNHLFQNSYDDGSYYCYELRASIKFADRAALSALPRADADEAALADLALDYLSVAQPEFCSARCPSVGREGVPIPHLSECESMRSLLTARVDSAKDAPRWKPIADPGAIVSTELLGKLTKLANYLTEQGEYEAVDLIDTVVARLAAQAGER